MPEGPGMLEGGGRRERGGLLPEGSCGWGRGDMHVDNTPYLNEMRREEGSKEEDTDDGRDHT